MTPKDAQTLLQILRELTEPAAFNEVMANLYSDEAEAKARQVLSNFDAVSHPYEAIREERPHQIADTIRRALGPQEVPPITPLQVGGQLQPIADGYLDLADWGDVLITRCRQSGISLFSTTNSDVFRSNDMGDAWLNMPVLKQLAESHRAGGQQI